MSLLMRRLSSGADVDNRFLRKRYLGDDIEMHRSKCHHLPTPDKAVMLECLDYFVGQLLREKVSNWTGDTPPSYEALST